MRGGYCLAAVRHVRATAASCRVFVVVAALVSGCVSDVPKSPPVAILVSDRLAAYQEVAGALHARLAQAPVYALDGDAPRAREVIDKLREDQTATVITIGPLATRAAMRLTGRSIVYCQDFSADDARAPQPFVRGVRATPPPLKQLQAWKALDPRLRRVTLVSGAGLGDFVRGAQAAAQQLKVELDHIEVHSDRELLYVVKRLEGDVQGLWFAPDNRVLSADVLREALAYTMRQGKQTLVFNAQLLSLGALLSVESDPDDIAERVLEQLRAGANSPRLASLQRARVTINTKIAGQLGLVVPVAMQAGLYVF